MKKRSINKVAAIKPTLAKTLAEQKIDFTSEGAVPLAIAQSKAVPVIPLPSKKGTETEDPAQAKDLEREQDA